MTTSPGQDFIDALQAMIDACERMGVSRPTMIGMRSMLAVNAVEREVKGAIASGHIREVIGGFEVSGVAIKQRSAG